MRVRTIACSCLLLAVSAGGAKTLAAASPDCSRWIKEYQQGLSRRAVLGKKHVVKAAHHLVIPLPHLQRVSTAPSRVRPPKLSPSEMLKRFKVLCGEDLPDEVLPATFVQTGLEDTTIPQADSPGNSDQIASLSGNRTPPLFSPPTDNGTPPPSQPTNPNNGGGTTNGGLPNGPLVPGGGGGGTPTTPTTPPIPTPVPEPGTLVLLLTGLGMLPAVLAMRRSS